MKKLVVLFSVLLSIQLLPQVPDPAFNPMTAPGARGISILIHTLYWQNPSGVLYNEVYFSDDSSLVANLDISVRVKNGYPATIYSSFPLNEYGTLSGNTKYFWRVVEYNAQGSSSSPLWYFYTFGISYTEYQYNFDANLDGWQILGPQGLNNWYWSNTTHTDLNPGEAVFRWDPVFTGESYLISPEMNAPPYSAVEVYFKYYEDWWSDTVVVGCAYTTDNGNNWISIWDLHATGNVGPTDVMVSFYITSNFKLGFYYTGNSNNLDFFYVDGVIVTPLIVLTPPTPPGMLTTVASSTEQNVSLNWTAGWAEGLYGYNVQRKEGDPTNNSPYVTIVTTDINTLSYNDPNVELGQTYTYRVRSLGMVGSSQFGNEATAYVPPIVPVELLSFFSSVNDDGVTLNWTTATETNNSGFEIQRLNDSKIEKLNEWVNIGFVTGHGTTTEQQTYSFLDENLSAGKYQYRLKQIDFDGTFEYSNIVDVEILPPAKFSLEQNYPNPFNPTTKIRWQSPVSSWQILKVFDVLGNEVATLMNEYKPAGIYEVEIDASKLSSGVYYYQLKATEFFQTKKMTLIK